MLFELCNLLTSHITYREDMFTQQEQQKKIEQEWKCEQKRLLHTIENKEWYMTPCIKTRTSVFCVFASSIVFCVFT